MFHFKPWLMIMPSNLALVTNLRGLPFRTRGSKSYLLFENPIRSSLHLASISWNPSILACLERSSTTSWSLLTLSLVTILEKDVSSTYFHMLTGVSKSGSSSLFTGVDNCLSASITIYNLIFQTQQQHV